MYKAEWKHSQLAEWFPNTHSRAGAVFAGFGAPPACWEAWQRFNLHRKHVSSF